MRRTLHLGGGSVRLIDCGVDLALIRPVRYQPVDRSGYPDDKVAQLVKEAVQAGWTHFKMKVGASLEDDLRMIRRIIDDARNCPAGVVCGDAELGRC